MILITGGTGFVGSTLIKQLIDQGIAVMATKREHSIVPEMLKSSSLVEWVNADITDYFALADLFPSVRQVYHCAAAISYDPVDWKQMLHTNISGTQHIVNLCLEHQARLVHVSSIAALGTNKQGEPVQETDKWDPALKISKYALSKYDSEMEVWRGIAEGLDAVIVNPSVIMGAALRSKGAAAIFKMVQKGIKVYPTGTVGIVDVEDVVRCMLLLMQKKEISGERFVLNGSNISNKDLLARIALLLDKPAPQIAAAPWLLSIAWRLAKVGAWIKGGKPAITQESASAASAKLAYSSSKICRTLNYTFKPLEETLTQMSKQFI